MKESARYLSFLESANKSFTSIYIHRKLQYALSHRRMEIPAPDIDACIGVPQI